MSDSQSFAQRRASGLSGRSPSSYTAPAPHWQSHSRKSSQSSQNSNGHGGLGSGIHGDIDNSLNGISAGNGLGSLADELNEGWDEEDDYDTGYDDGAQHLAHGNGLETEEQRSHAQHLIPPPSPTKRRPGSPLKRDYNDSAYDGSEYGDEKELEPAAGITPGLEKWMGEIEALARQGADLTDPVWTRFANSLNDLPSQFEIENNAGRLITSYSAVTSHLNNQSRAFTTTTHSLVSPFSLPPDPATIEEIVPLVASLVTMLPKPPSDSVSNLHNLNNQTADLLAQLRTVGDSLFMVQTTMYNKGAVRLLDASKDLVNTLRKDIEAAEEGERWLEQGDWNNRIKSRQAQKTCEDVVNGFEKTCDEWRQRIIDNHGGSSALDATA